MYFYNYAVHIENFCSSHGFNVLTEKNTIYLPFLMIIYHLTSFCLNLNFDITSCKIGQSFFSDLEKIPQKEFKIFNELNIAFLSKIL